MYSVKGYLTKKEYYGIYLWRRRFYFLLSVLLILVPVLWDVEPRYLLTLSFYQDYWNVILFNWLIYSAAALLGTFIGVFLLAFLKRESSLQTYEYTFSDEQITVRTKIGENRIPWKKVLQLNEQKRYSSLLLQSREQIYLMNRFFDNQKHKKETLSFIRERLVEKR